MTQPITWRQRLKQALFHISPQAQLIRSFVLLILGGALGLCLPYCQNHAVGFLDCLFIATSAVCVTGLISVDFPVVFNQYGQLVVLFLIQLGGLGVLTFAAVAFKIIGTQISMTAQAALTDAVMQKDAAGEFRDVFYKMLALVAGIEVCGMVLLTLDRWRVEPLATALWQGLFHSVSAFCNAGFSLWSNSLCNQSHFFCTVIMALIVCGGIGLVALVEIMRGVKSLIKSPSAPALRLAQRRHLSYNTRVALIVSGALIAWGMLMLMITDLGTAYHISWFEALFQAISARTAGFNNFDQAELSRTDILTTIGLMFIGGSPGSCAGGIKTTTFAIWLATCAATLGNRDEITFAGRKIPEILVDKARKLIQFSLIWNIAGVFILCRTEIGANIITLMYEQISAFGTVGLSLNFTDELSILGKVWIILTMFIGRMGPLTIALGIKHSRSTSFSHPEGRIMIG